MQGKIFSDSTNVYQDQAKLLFHFYRQAAEKIVAEEEGIEKKVEALEQEREQLEAEAAKAKLYKWLFCILIIPFFIYNSKENKLNKKIEGTDERITEFKKMHRELFRDYKVTKLGIAYTPIANQVKSDNKSFVVDYTGTIRDSEFKLQMSRQNDLLIKKIGELEDLLEEAPIVESSSEVETVDTEDYSLSMQQLNQHDYFGSLDRTLRTISYCMDDMDVTSVSLPLIANESPYLDQIKEFATAELPGDAVTFEVFDSHKYDAGISKFQELNRLKDSLSRQTRQFEDVLKGLMATMADSIQALSALKVASADKMVTESNKILFRILKAPYNHYSPILEGEEIERIRNEKFNYSEAVQDYEPFQLKDSSRVRFDLVSDNWVAEDGKTTNFPFGVHHIYEEIVAPIVKNLMQETRLERLKIYNHIKDQKISYLNKWHQDTEDFYGRNRAEAADLINLMRGNLREYVAAFNALVSYKKTMENMQNEGSIEASKVESVGNSAEMLASFEMQSKEFQLVQEQFEEYMERLKEDIDAKAEKFEHIDYYDAKLSDGYFHEMAVAVDEAQDLEERRRRLAVVNPLFAKDSDLPPEPTVSEMVAEHMSMNLSSIAKNALEELDNMDRIAEEAERAAAESGEVVEEELTVIIEEEEEEIVWTEEDGEEELDEEGFEDDCEDEEESFEDDDDSEEEESEDDEDEIGEEPEEESDEDEDSDEDFEEEELSDDEEEDDEEFEDEDDLDEDEEESEEDEEDEEDFEDEEDEDKNLKK